MTPNGRRKSTGTPGSPELPHCKKQTGRMELMKSLWMHCPYQTNSCCGQLRRTCTFWRGTYYFIYFLRLPSCYCHLCAEQRPEYHRSSFCAVQESLLVVLLLPQSFVPSFTCSTLYGSVLLSCCPSLHQFLDLVFYVDCQDLESWQIGSIQETLFRVIFYEQRKPDYL